MNEQIASSPSSGVPFSVPCFLCEKVVHHTIPCVDQEELTSPKCRKSKVKGKVTFREGCLSFQAQFGWSAEDGRTDFRVSGREAEKTEGSDSTWRKKEKS